MKVYNVVFDVDNYQSLLVKDQNVLKRKLLSIGGISKKQEWPNVLDTITDNICAPPPHIYCCEATNMVLTTKTLDILVDVLPKNIELLPVKWLNDSGYITNVVGYVDCLNTDETEWFVDDALGKKLFVDKFVFIKEKIP